MVVHDEFLAEALQLRRESRGQRKNRPPQSPIIPVLNQVPPRALIHVEQVRLPAITVAERLEVVARHPERKEFSGIKNVRIFERLIFLVLPVESINVNLRHVRFSRKSS